jgi:transcriptional regulator with XRE-family HTH domain
VSKRAHYKDGNAIKAFGKRVRQIREQQGLTIEEFANRSELHATQVGRIERGETNVTISYIYLLAVALGIEPDVLLKQDK